MYSNFKSASNVAVFIYSTLFIPVLLTFYTKDDNANVCIIQYLLSVKSSNNSYC